METARLVIEVTAGVMPGKPDHEFTRRYVITSTQWEEAKDQPALLAEINGKAQGYAAMLMMQPDRLNQVMVDWLWM